MLSLEINTVCNAKCIMCPQSTLARRGKTMPKKDVLSIVEQAVEGLDVKRVQPHLYGESHLHPDYVEILSEIKRRWPNVILSDTTNGSALTKPEIATTMYTHLDKLTISLDGATAGMIEDIRPGLHGAAVIEGVIENLGRQDCGQEILVNTVVMDLNRAHVRLIGDMLRATGRKLGHGICEVSDLHGHTESGKPLRDMSSACSRPFHVVTVNVLGDMILCCRDQDSEEVFGTDLAEGGLVESWNSPAFSQLRMIHEDETSDLVDLCSRCTYKGYMRKGELCSE